MDTLTLVLLIYFIVVHSMWLTTLICHLSTKTDKLGTAMLYVAVVITVPYIGLLGAIEQFHKKRAQMRKANEEANEETDEGTNEEKVE